MTLLSATDITVQAGAECLVDPVSISLPKGEAVTILGESGSGKAAGQPPALGSPHRGFAARTVAGARPADARHGAGGRKS